MYSRCQKIGLFFSSLGKMISDAIYAEYQTNLTAETQASQTTHRENHMPVDTGQANSNILQGAYIRALFQKRRNVVNPFTGERIELSARAQQPTATSLNSPALQAFISARRDAEIQNNALSEHGYKAGAYQLTCPILQDFPLIPVLFNGRLFDYDSLMKLAKSGFIKDPITREEIKLAPHVVQPHYEAQNRMDDLLNEIKNKNHQTNSIK